MDTEQTAESPADDTLLNKQILEESAEVSEPEESHSLRRKRVAEYESVGLEKLDPLEACLAAINADLIRISFSLGDVIQQSLATETATAETVRRVEATLNNQLRVTRQIDRFAQLEVRAAEARLEAARCQARQQMRALQGHLKDAASRGARSIPGNW